MFMHANVDTAPGNSADLTFHHQLSIYLKDSNAYGNTYFARYFEWQGICREKWFYECISRDMLQQEGMFITKHAQQDFLQETFPFQDITCEVNSYDVRRCSFWLEFRFHANGTLVATGRQQLVFASHTKQIKALPELVQKRIGRYALKKSPHRQGPQMPAVSGKCNRL